MNTPLTPGPSPTQAERGEKENTFVAGERGALPFNYWTVQQDGAQLTEGGVIEESTVSIYINGQEMATVMCSPLDQEALAVGFLYNEGVIQSLEDIGLVKANLPRNVV